MQISPLLILGIIGAGYLASKSTKTYIITVGSSPQAKSKYPGYIIKDQLLIITDVTKAKNFVFTTGKTKPEGNLFKLIFGHSYIEFSDVKKGFDNNLIVKDKAQQDNVYVLLSYLFAGAYIQNPHRAGAYADQLNNYVSYIKKMFDIDYPILKSVDQAKSFFKELADKMK